MANHFTPLLLLVMTMFSGIVASYSGTFANSLHRVGRFDGNVSATNITENKSPLTCLWICIDHNSNSSGSCRAFNYQASTRTCEVLSEALCEGDEMLRLNKDDDSWHYYDITDDPSKEISLGFRGTPYCTEEGKCSEKCERQLGSTCVQDEQCRAIEKNSYCTAANVATPGICKCKEHYWAYNSSLCIHQISFGFTYNWVHKKIVNNMCSMTFTARAKTNFILRLMSDIDVYSGLSRYEMYVGYSSNTLINLYKRTSTSTLVSSVSSPGILSENFQNFTWSWCNGAIKFGNQGQSPLLQWTDSTPYNILGMGFYSNGEHNHVFVPHNLVDAFFTDNLENGVLRGIGHGWHVVKINPDRSYVSDINFVFEYKAIASHCSIMFSHRRDLRGRYQVEFGVNNLQARLYNGRLLKWVQIIEAPNLLDNTFKRFWINVRGNTITAGKDSDPTPIISYTDTSLVPQYSHIGIANCCNDRNAYFKILSHPQFHEYPKGGYT